MADNVAITAGSGTTIAADDVGGVLHQRVKVSLGADGSASDVSTANPLPAELRDSDLSSRVNLTGLRDLQVAQRYTMWFDSLADGVSAAWTQTTANGGTVTNTGGEGLLKTSTATNGSSQIVGPVIPYYAGRQEWFNSAIRTGDTGVAGNIRRWGKYTVSGTTPQDGFYYELSGTTLNAVTVKGGSATAVAAASWTLVGTNPFTLDANFHQWEIRYTANTAWFYIDGVLRHVAGGSTAAPLTNTLSLPISATNVKTSGATDITLAIRNIGTGGFGFPYGAIVETGTNALVAGAVGGGTPHDAVDSGNPVKIGGYANASAPSDVANADRVNAWFLRNGALAAVITAAGALIGGDATNGLDVDVTRVPTSSTMNASSSDGATPLTNSAQAIKASAGTLTGYYIYNPNTATAYVQFYNTASGSVTVGTTNPLFMLSIPSGSAANLAGLAVAFGTAISWAATSTAGGNGAPTTALDAVAWYN